MRFVQEDPRSVMTVRFEEGEQALTPRPLQSSQVRTSGDSRVSAVKSSEIRWHEITWTVDLRIYRDPPWPLDLVLRNIDISEVGNVEEVVTWRSQVARSRHHRTVHRKGRVARDQRFTDSQEEKVKGENSENSRGPSSRFDSGRQIQRSVSHWFGAPKYRYFGSRENGGESYREFSIREIATRSGLSDRRVEVTHTQGPDTRFHDAPFD
jgi:hypothetical protein